VDTVAIFNGIRLSHDGRRLGAVISDRGDDIRVFGISTGTSTRLTFSSGDETSVVWSPDDSKIAYSSNMKDGGDVFTINSSGGTEEPLWVGPGEQRPTDWARDGSSLLAYVIGQNTGTDIWIYSLTERRAVLWLQTPFNEFDGTFSPDGKWIAYTSDESGRAEVYVQSRDRLSKWQISRGGGREPHWRGDGGEIFYLSTDEPPPNAQQPGASGSGGTASIYAVDVTGAKFEDAKPARLFSFLQKANQLGATYDVSADGKTFHLNTLATNTDSPLTIVQNWTELLTSPRP
jgi:Tol biopolymer transport system component